MFCGGLVTFVLFLACLKMHVFRISVVKKTIIVDRIQLEQFKIKHFLTTSSRREKPKSEQNLLLETACELFEGEVVCSAQIFDWKV